MQLGLDAQFGAGLGHVFGTVDYSQHLAAGLGLDIAAFARGYGGAVNLGRGWQPEVGVLGGVGMRW